MNGIEVMMPSSQTSLHTCTASDTYTLSEWYSYHFPELVKIVNDNFLFAKLVHLIKRRNNINEELFVSCHTRLC